MYTLMYDIRHFLENKLFDDIRDDDILCSLYNRLFYLFTVVHVGIHREEFGEDLI